MTRLTRLDRGCWGLFRGKAAVRSENDRKAMISCELKRILSDSLRKTAVRDWVRDRESSVFWRTIVHRTWRRNCLGKSRYQKMLVERMEGKQRQGGRYRAIHDGDAKVDGWCGEIQWRA